MRRRDLDQSLIKEYVTEALLELLEKKDYNDISVGEISERAGVHRATFYRHFSSKEDVLRVFLTDTFQKAERDCTLQQKDFTAFIQPVFQALYDKKKQILLMNRASLAGLLMDALKDYFNFEESGLSGGAVTEGYREAYRIGGIYSCLLLWFSRGMRETPEKMAQIAASL